MSLYIIQYLVVERAVMELAEALVLVGVFQWYLVGELEEEESEGFSRNKVEAWLLDIAHVARTWFRFGGATEGMNTLLHLFEPVYD
jgi:hypothetical protein